MSASGRSSESSVRPAALVTAMSEIFMETRWFPGFPGFATAAALTTTGWLGRLHSLNFKNRLTQGATWRCSSCAKAAKGSSKAPDLPTPPLEKERPADVLQASRDGLWFVLLQLINRLDDKLARLGGTFGRKAIPPPPPPAPRRPAPPHP